MTTEKDYLESYRDPFCHVKADGTLSRVNITFINELGLGSSDYDRINNLADYLPEVKKRQFLEELDLAMANRTRLEFDIPVMREGWKTDWIHGKIAPVKDEDGGGFAVNCNRITERKLKEIALERLSETDTLTGVPNRHALEKFFNQQRKNRDLSLAVVIIDVNDFKLINDRLGHNCGDEVLRQLAQKLSDISRAGDVFGRWGGDEFLFLLTSKRGKLNKEALVHFCERVYQACELLQIGDQKISVSAGTYLFDPGTDKPLEQGIKNADKNMYKDKRNYHLNKHDQSNLPSKLQTLVDSLYSFVRSLPQAFRRKY